VQIQLTHHFFSCITGIETNMLLIVFWGLIAKLALVSGDCNLGPPTLDDFDISRVGICVLTCLLKQAVCSHIEINFFINLYIILTV
jgi:hypothetical protein